MPNSISAGELTALSRDPLAGLRAYFYAEGGEEKGKEGKGK